MLTPYRRVVFQAFIVSLGIWTGAGVHDTLMNHFAWWGDPVAYVRTRVFTPGLVNPWPFTTAILALLTLTGLASFARYKGEAKRALMIIFGGMFVVLLATGIYFVPQLGLFGPDTTLTDADIIRHSKDWIRYNAVRLVVLIALFYYALSTLARMSARRDATV
jgi:hypothetical protein